MATFVSFPDVGQRRDLTRFNTEMVTRTPIQQYDYVDVTFSAANTDTGIPHTLQVTNADTVRWHVVSINANTNVYRNTTGTAVAWTGNQIWLRAGAVCVARLIVFVEN